MHMKHNILKIVTTALLLTVQLTATAQTEKTPAFPGAEGFGRYVTGGRGGKVYHVTNLNDSGIGSLRWANSQPGPRTIVFDVSGTIYLKSALKFAPNTTVAGQTAPGDGICLVDYPVTIGSNVIVRYMRFRLGNRHVDKHEGDGLGSLDENNIIVDHCSVSWSIDECLSVYGGRNLTVQWCLVSQSLVNSGHTKGSHGYGGNWGGSGASFHHNLIAHHTSRTPRLGPRQSTQTDERMDMRCNVIYNFGGNGCYGGEGMNVNIVNNYYKPGPGSPTGTKGMRIAGIGIRTTDYCTNSDGTWNGWYPMWHVWGKYFVEGNVNTQYSQVTRDNWTYGMYNQITNGSGVDYTYTQLTKDTMRITEPIPFVCVTTHAAEQAYERVLSYAGASLHRDQLDNIIISDTRNGQATYTGTGLGKGFINSQNDVAAGIGGDESPWPALNTQEAPADSDGDGMPDAWETGQGLNPADANDGNMRDEKGYTMLENYLSQLVADITEAQNQGGSVEGYTEEATEEDLTGALTIPTEALDPNKANIITNPSGRNAAKVLNNSFDSFSHNDQAVFMLNCKEAGSYTFTYEAATTRNDFRLRFDFTDQKSGRTEGTKTQAIANTGAWQTYRTYTFETDLTIGIKLLTMTWLSSNGQYTGNVKNIRVSLTAESAVNDIHRLDDTVGSPLFNLSGQRVNNNARPGIYIQNGQKIVIR